MEDIKNLDIELKSLLAKVEAILFTMGEAVEIRRIAEAVGHDEDTVRNCIRELSDRYRDESFGVQIIELDGSFQMCTKPEMPSPKDTNTPYGCRVSTVPS